MKYLDAWSLEYKTKLTAIRMQQQHKGEKKIAKIDEETDTNKRKIQASRIKEDAGSKIEDGK